MKSLFLIITLLVSSPLYADSITEFSGKVHEPPATVTYSFTVQQFIEPTFIADILNGFVHIQNGSIGCNPCGATFINDVYEFMPWETIILVTFGTEKTEWDLIDGPNGLQLLDPPKQTPTQTPEPSVLLMLLAGLALVRQRAKRQAF